MKERKEYSKEEIRNARIIALILSGYSVMAVVGSLVLTQLLFDQPKFIYAGGIFLAFSVVLIPVIVKIRKMNQK